MANGETISRVIDVIKSDPQRKYIVVSAPGKRNKADVKVTDALYACFNEKTEKGNCTQSFEVVRKRFKDIVTALDLDFDIDSVLDEVKAGIDNSVSSDYAASRGEYLNALILAKKLGFEFIDTQNIVKFNGEKLQMHYSLDLIKQKLDGVEYAVIPGFYGSNQDGRITTFSRGGSDITGALIARAVGADVYENWTDVPGIFRADPAIVPSARAIPAMAYDEVRELAYMGANVLHEDAVTPARRMGIPIHIRSTMQPDAPGTLVSSQSPPSACPVTGIAGRKGYCSIQVEKENMNSAVGYCRRILSVLETHEIPFDHIATGLGSISFIAPAAAVSACREALLSDISAAVRPDSICVADGLAMVSIVGRDMAGRPGVSGRLLCALGRAGINVRMVVQGTREINITVGISEPEYEKAVHAVHGEFFPEAPQ